MLIASDRKFNWLVIISQRQAVFCDNFANGKNFIRKLLIKFDKILLTHGKAQLLIIAAVELMLPLIGIWQGL